MMCSITLLIAIIVVCTLILGSIKVHERFYQTDMYKIEEKNIDMMKKFDDGYIVSPFLRVQDTLSIGNGNEASIKSDGTLNAKRICINNKCTNVGFDNDSINGIKLSGSWSDSAGYGRSEISNDTMGLKGLVIAGNSSAGSGKKVIVKDHMLISGNIGIQGTTEGKAFISSKDGYTVKNHDNDKVFMGYKPDGSFGIYSTSSNPIKFDHNSKNRINMSDSKTTVNVPIIFENIDDGILIEKRQDDSTKNRYGLAKYNDNLIMYGPEPTFGPSAAVSMGFLRNRGEFDSVLIAKNNGDVVAKNRVCVNTTCVDEPDLIRIKNPVPPPKPTQLCLEDVCIGKSELNGLKSMLSNPPSSQTKL